MQYRTVPMIRHKGRRIPVSTRTRILERDNYTCVYCGFDADSIDHIVPWSSGGREEDDNLVAACMLCNGIAGNKVFDPFADKRDHVRARYGPYLQRRFARLRKQLSMCGDCQCIYRPNLDGASALLCSECYAASQTGRRTFLALEAKESA